ncbi:ovochymase-1 [Pyxicephalus adspersus]|uniref:ovochymase-1 n=1 Tax=Pyxicephalus adspersus TaxID=30357 RepID=UPI003B5BE9CF
MKCGVQPTKMMARDFLQANSRIIGGEDAEEGGQPWTFVSELSHLQVIAGEYNRTAIDAEQQNISVSGVKIHPKYRPDGSMTYDIALLYLAQSITLGSEVQLICLPQVGEEAEIGTLCVSSGWGRVGENAEFSNVLQVVTLPILDSTMCGSVLNSMGLPALHSSMLCAGFPGGGKDACQGDSGGPLVCQRRSGTWFLAGTTSWGVGCGRAWKKPPTSSETLGSPAIFARISAVLDFLRNSTTDSDFRGSLLLTFADFAVEFQEECLYDHVSVYSDIDHTQLIVTLCGYSVTEPIFSPGNIMVIVFESDAENNFFGFKAMFKFLNPATEEIKPLPFSGLRRVPDLKRISKSVCGMAPLSTQWILNRIVGGEEACPNCWPWNVELMFQGGFVCGGVILSPEWVLTAAHCLLSPDPSLYLIIGGIHDRFLNASNEQRRNVLAITAHENFNILTFNYDVGMLRVEEPFVFNDFVRPVCLPRKNEPIEPSSLCVVTGWGGTGEVGNFSSRLQQLQVPILNTEVCNTTYYPGMISKQMICAGFPETGGKDACTGDSGGPLVCLSTNNSYVVYGIVSWGVGCARAKKPGVYARIRSLLSWIEDTLQERNDQINYHLTLPERPVELPAWNDIPSVQGGCPSQAVLQAGSGDLKSPGYPMAYKKNLDCWWNLYASPGRQLRIVIIDLALEKSPNCTWDALTIYDGANNQSQLLVTLCGNVSDLTLQSNGSHLTLHYQTNLSMTGHGFHLKYNSVNEETPQSQKMIITNRNCGWTLVDPLVAGGPKKIPEIVTNETRTVRVVGGQVAPWNSWPWIASMQSMNRTHYCGATIIHETWLVTAAHCRFIVGFDRVFVGINNLSQPEQTEVFVKRTFTHILYDPEYIPPEHDLRLLELKTPLVLGASVGIMCLPEKEEEFTDNECLTAGWGAVKGKQFPKILQQAKIPLVTKEECMKIWGPDITEGNMCAGAAGASSCVGDSGGPLICKVKNRYKLVGIVSWGSNLCDPKTPAVYTSLSKYRDWIQEHTGV